MEPPRHICERLDRLHPWGRLAWMGPVSGFALVELYRPREPVNSFQDQWVDSLGPIFSKKGRPRRDFDAMARVPILKYVWKPGEVYRGDFLWDIRAWMRPVAARLQEDYQARKKADDDLLDAAGESMGRDFYRQAQRHVVDAPIVAKKFLTKQPELLRYERGIESITTPPVPPPGGWEKWEKRDQELGGAAAARVLPE